MERPVPTSGSLDRAWIFLASLVVVAAAAVTSVELLTRPCRCQPRTTRHEPKEREPIARFGPGPWTWHVGILSRPGTLILYLGRASLRIEPGRG